MLTGRKLLRFRNKLLGWFGKFQRDLPWRRSKNPYRIWVSEIMLQQTRVAAVLPYYERFLERFPDIQTLARAPEGDILRLWSGLGYYSRARNLQRAAQQISEKNEGVFPSEEREALALPGIGRYTAAAILSIAYGKKLAVLDGNVARVLARIGAIRGDLRAGNRWQRLQKTADSLLASQAPGDWNQAMMELGATLCTPKSPQCLLCPVSEFCKSRKLGLAEVIPDKRKKRDIVEIMLAALVFVDALGRTVVLSPPKSDGKADGPVGGIMKPNGHQILGSLVSRLWHFPTIEISGDAVTELRGYLHALDPRTSENHLYLAALEKVRHTVTHRDITVLPFRLDVKKLPRFRNARFLPLSDLSSVPISNLTRKVAGSALSSLGTRVQQAELD